uniref:Chromo domain-containing protein n=1 Tax=Haemonchus contortus TaxID=6289 RepID=A0A7I5E700_HAECO
MKEQYDRRFRTHKVVPVKEGDRVYVKIPSEKGKVSHPKLTTAWSGPYRVIESSANSALVTLIGQNKEPVRVQWDHLMKIPPMIDDTPLETKGFRGRRGRRSKLTSNHCNMIRNQFIFKESSITKTSPLHVDFICPGGLSIDGQRLPCSTNMTWHEITGMRSSPIDGLTFDCVFKLAGVATIMSQTHTIFGDANGSYLGPGIRHLIAKWTRIRHFVLLGEMSARDAEHADEIRYGAPNLCDTPKSLFWRSIRLFEPF